MRKKHPVKYVSVPDQWLKRIGVAWCGENREWGEVINHKRNSQPPRSKLFGFENIVKQVSIMFNKTPGVDGFCASNMKLMGAFGLMKLGELFDTPFDQMLPAL